MSDKQGCGFCKDNEIATVWGEGGAHDFRISQGALYYYDEQFGWEGIPIAYCPMCGRRISDYDWEADNGEMQS